MVILDTDTYHLKGSKLQNLLAVRNKQRISEHKISKIKVVSIM